MDDLAKLSEAATSGEWRVYRIDQHDSEHPKIIDTRYGIVTGKTKDEIRICEISSDRDYYTPEGAFEKAADAEFAVALVNAYRAGRLKEVA